MSQLDTYLRALLAELDTPASSMLEGLAGSPSANHSAYFLIQLVGVLRWPLFEYIENGAVKATWAELARAITRALEVIEGMTDEQVREYLAAKYPRHASKF